MICIVRFVYASYQENMFTRVPPEPHPSPVRAPSEPRPSPVRASPEYSPERVFPDGICYVCLRHTTGGRLGDSAPLPRQGSSVDDACGSRAGSYLAVSLFLPGEKRLPGSQKSTIKSSLENVCRGGRHHPLFRRVLIQKLTTQLPGGGKGIHRSREWNPPPARREDHRSRSFCFSS